MTDIVGVMSADCLTMESCSVLITNNGENFRRAFVNSERGRKELKEFCNEETYNKVIEVWGDEALVPEIERVSAYVEPPRSTEMTLEEKVDLLMMDKLIRDGVISGE